MTSTQRRRFLMLLIGAALCAGAIWYGIRAADPNRRHYDGPMVDSPYRFAR